MVLFALKIRPPLHISPDILVAGPSFKNLYIQIFKRRSVKIIKQNVPGWYILAPFLASILKDAPKDVPGGMSHFLP